LITPIVSRITRLKPNGSTVVTVSPPRPCGLSGCIAELLVEIKSQGAIRAHLDAEQVTQLVHGLGGTVPEYDLVKLRGAFDLVAQSRNRNRAEAKRWRERALALGYQGPEGDES